MRGSYQVGDVAEQFSCGSGPAGWRYTSHTDHGDTLDLTVEQDGRVRRVLAVFDGWEVRGGTVGEEVHWVRGDDEHTAVAAGFTGRSPAFDIAVARMLALEVGQTAQVTLVELTDPVGAARTVTHGWGRTECREPPTDGAVDVDRSVDRCVDRYEVADLATGERWVLHLAPEVLVSREGARQAHLADLSP